MGSKISGRKLDLDTYFLAQELPEIHDQFQKLKDSVAMKRDKDPGLMSIMVSSENHGNGATMVAVNLALALARSDLSRVLLVDADLRHPTLHEAFDLENTEGFSDILQEKISPEQGVRSTETPRLSVVPVGSNSIHPSQLDMSKLEGTLIAFKNDFDYIIFNSSPINKYSDSIVLAAHLDAAILVIQAESTKWDDLERAKSQLEQRGVQILGVVMNRRKYFIPNFIYRRFLT